MLPHLKTALSGPLLELEKSFLDNIVQIEQWFRARWLDHEAPFYASTDLRNAGFKLAPVDLNLFPGGFNNLSESFLPFCVQAVQAAVDRICPGARRFLLIPESHTRNQFYLENVAALVRILRVAGLDLRVGTLIAEVTEATEFDLPNGEKIMLEPLVRKADGRVGLADFDPCAILLNNDLSVQAPEILQNIDEQWLLPPLHMGWFSRRKSVHAGVYSRLVDEFCQELGSVDPWQINPAFRVCDGMNFQAREGGDCLAEEVDALLAQIREKYQQYGITETPFAVIKADAGTYGMAVMTVRDAAEVKELNRRQRKKMAVGKEGRSVDQVIIQEGVHSFELLGESVAEPVVYMMDRHVVGGFYRVHTGRGRDESLNAPGMHFEPLAFEDETMLLPDDAQSPDAPPNRFYAYSVIARLALLAAAIEIEETAPPTAQ